MKELWFYYTESEVLATMGNIWFFWRPSSIAAARAVVTGADPALMGTSGSRSNITHAQRWVERDRLVPQQHLGCPWQQDPPALLGRCPWARVPESQLTPQKAWAFHLGLLQLSAKHSPGFITQHLFISLSLFSPPPQTQLVWDCGQSPSPKNSQHTNLIENWTKNLSTPYNAWEINTTLKKLIQVAKLWGHRPNNTNED